ncbi:MAG TPA: hypothetical protein VF613_25220 [Longimicrobium sp.]|jgi:hypothetical protein
MPLSSRRALGALYAAFACAALGACADVPSAPESFVRDAGGATWVAVVEPAGLPTARTWLSAFPDQAPASSAARATLAEAARVRRTGAMEAFLTLEDRAAREAAAALPAAPEARVVLSGLAAADEWVERASVRTVGGRFPELARAELAVRENGARARSLLAAGDTLGAVREITIAAEVARAWAPVSVALRVVRDAEARIDSTPNPSAGLVRARRLLRGAREGIAIGDHARALQRAMYALQLIEQEGRR